MKDVVCALWTLVVCLLSSLLMIFLCMIDQTANQSDVSHRQAPPLIQHAQSAQKPTSTTSDQRSPTAQHWPTFRATRFKVTLSFCFKSSLENSVKITTQMLFC